MLHSRVSRSIQGSSKNYLNIDLTRIFTNEMAAMRSEIRLPLSQAFVNVLDDQTIDYYDTGT